MRGKLFFSTHGGARRAPPCKTSAFRADGKPPRPAATRARSGRGANFGGTTLAT